MKRIKRVNQQEKKMKSLKRNYQKEVERGNPVMDSAMNSIRKEIEILKEASHKTELTDHVVEISNMDGASDSPPRKSNKRKYCSTAPFLYWRKLRSRTC